MIRISKWKSADRAAAQGRVWGLFLEWKTWSIFVKNLLRTQKNDLLISLQNSLYLHWTSVFKAMNPISLIYAHSFCQFYDWSNNLKRLKQSELTELVSVIDAHFVQSITQSCSWNAQFLGEALEMYFSDCSSLFHTFHARRVQNSWNLSSFTQFICR